MSCKRLAFLMNHLFLQPSARVSSIAIMWLWIASLLVGCTTKQPTADSRDGVSEPAATQSNIASNVKPPPTNEVTKELSHFAFEDRTQSLGVDFTYRNGDQAKLYSIVESLGGGVAIFDFDGDGQNDLLFPGGGTFQADGTTPGLPTGLFWNRGSRFAAVADQTGISFAANYSHGVEVGDYDNDGWPDVLISGYNHLALFHNQGDGTFELRQAWSSDIQPLWTTSLSWGDFNGDGQLDIYAARYVNWSMTNNPICTATHEGARDICPPKSFEPLPDLLLISDGQGGFSDQSRTFGLQLEGKGLGVLCADWDNDGDLDIYVANDTTNNFLYLNQQGQSFEEVGLLHGAAVDERGLPNGSMGLAAADYDRDGWLDLWVANYERESFAMYRNTGHGQFTHFSRRLGIMVLNGSFVGFGTELCDFDQNGTPEIVVANGHVILHPTGAPYRQQPLLLALVEGRFQRQAFSTESYFGSEHLGRGLAVGELNGDGRPDIVISHLNEPVAVLINETPSERKSINVRLIGTASNRDAIGARVVVHQGAEQATYQIVGGGSYLSRSERVIRHIVTGDSPSLKLSIAWPNTAEIQSMELSADAGNVDIIQE